MVILAIVLLLVMLIRVKVRGHARVSFEIPVTTYILSLKVKKKNYLEE